MCEEELVYEDNTDEVCCLGHNKINELLVMCHIRIDRALFLAHKTDMKTTR